MLKKSNKMIFLLLLLYFIYFFLFLSCLFLYFQEGNKKKKIKEIKVLLDVRITYYSLICVNSFSSIWKLPHLALQRSILIANIIPGGFGILGS